jgi:hypothetical protein
MGEKSKAYYGINNYQIPKQKLPQSHDEAKLKSRVLPGYALRPPTIVLGTVVDSWRSLVKQLWRVCCK